MITMRKPGALVQRLFCSSLFLSLSISLCSQAVFADSLFDFDRINAPKKKSQQAAAIESYMEHLYGSEITVGARTQVVNSSGNLARTGAALSAPSDGYLKSGKGKNSGITLSFDASPISSFSVDSQVFKRGVGLIIKADGVIIYQHLLTTAERRSGIMDTIDPIFFDNPVHTIEFIGLKRTKIGIDNFQVNFDSLGPDGSSQVASVPEPSSLLMLGVGFFAAAWFLRRSTAKSISGLSITKN
jgi:hypothetical protein